MIFTGDDSQLGLSMFFTLKRRSWGKGRRQYICGSCLGSGADCTNWYWFKNNLILFSRKCSSFLHVSDMVRSEYLHLAVQLYRELFYVESTVQSNSSVRIFWLKCPNNQCVSEPINPWSICLSLGTCFILLTSLLLLTYFKYKCMSVKEYVEVLMHIRDIAWYL